MRLALVAFILRAWPVMPLRVKLWAFMNDDMPEHEDLRGWRR
jgi:hypothetical protein